MFWIEATVHALATKRATERHRDSPEAFDELLSMQAQMKVCAERGDFRAASAVNRSFHKAINYMADSPKLMSTLRNVSLGIQGDFIAEHPEWLSRSIGEHEEIIEAMRRGDGDKAGELMFRHTEGSAIKITNDLAGRDDEVESDESDFRGIHATLSAVFEDWVEDAATSDVPLRTDHVR
jgi:DNA-binding GntR family transcriptional regulator